MDINRYTSRVQVHFQYSDKVQQYSLLLEYESNKREKLNTLWKYLVFSKVLTLQQSSTPMSTNVGMEFTSEG